MLGKYHLCFLICAGFVLSACDAVPNFTVQQPPETDQAAPKEPTEKPAEKDKTQIDAKEDKPAPVFIEPETLIGLTPFELKNKLGEADYIRIDGNVEIYQYRLNHCIVDFIGFKEGLIKFWHGQHRKQGGIYNHTLCQQDLGERQSGQ